MWCENGSLILDMSEIGGFGMLNDELQCAAYFIFLYLTILKEFQGECTLTGC